jgi:hypothetical protein
LQELTLILLLKLTSRLAAISRRAVGGAIAISVWIHVKFSRRIVASNHTAKKSFTNSHTMGTVYLQTIFIPDHTSRSLGQGVETRIAAHRTTQHALFEKMKRNQVSTLRIIL